MKKLFIFFLVLLLSKTSLVNAQDGSSGGLPEAGDFFIEMTGSPYDGTSLLNFGSFRARFMVSESIVPRIGIHGSLSDYQTTPDKTYNSTEYLVTPGVEIHFMKEGSFRSYLAIDALIGQKFADASSVSGTGVVGSTQVPVGSNYSFDTSTRGFFRVGGNLSFGADYHFSSRFYAGVEIGFQYYRIMYSDVEVDGALYQSGTTVNNASVNRTNSFRVGFKLF